MLKFLVIFFVLIGFAAAADSRVCSDTNSKTLLKCYHDYFSHLSVADGLRFPPYNFYLRIFNDYNTPENLNDLCRYVKSLEKCLKDIERDCVSPSGFKQLTGDNEDQYDYPTNYGIIQYTCGEGLEAWKKIAQCTTDNGQAINNANNKCKAAFVNTSQTCEDKVTFLECTYVSLKKHCQQDAYNFACTADTNGMKFSTPDCLPNMIQCDDAPEPTTTTTAAPDLTSIHEPKVSSSANSPTIATPTTATATPDDLTNSSSEPQASISAATVTSPTTTNRHPGNGAAPSMKELGLIPLFSVAIFGL